MRMFLPLVLMVALLAPGFSECHSVGRCELRGQIEALLPKTTPEEQKDKLLTAVLCEVVKVSNRTQSVEKGSSSGKNSSEEGGGSSGERGHGDWKGSKGQKGWPNNQRRGKRSKRPDRNMFLLDTCGGIRSNSVNTTCLSSIIQSVMDNPAANCNITLPLNCP